MSGGSGTPVESAGAVSRPKMCIWRSGGPKSMGKHIVPESAPHYFLGNVAILDIFGSRPQLVLPACLIDKKYTRRSVWIYEIHTKPMKNQYLYGLNNENTHFPMKNRYFRTKWNNHCGPENRNNSNRHPALKPNTSWNDHNEPQTINDPKQPPCIENKKMLNPHPVYFNIGSPSYWKNTRFQIR